MEHAEKKKTKKVKKEKEVEDVSDSDTNDTEVHLVNRKLIITVMVKVSVTITDQSAQKVQILVHHIKLSNVKS